MLEQFTSAGYRDFTQRYHNTFIWYNNENKRLLVKVTDVGQDVMTFTDEKKMTYTANADQGVQFESVPCQRGLYNVGNEVVYVSRKAVKQYRRGLCNDNTSIHGFFYGPLPVTFDNVKSIFGEKGKDVNYVEEWLQKKREGVAFTTQFAVWSNVLYIYNQKIGVVDGKVFRLTNSIFQQEVKDFIRNLNLPFTVEIDK